MKATVWRGPNPACRADLHEAAGARFEAAACAITLPYESGCVLSENCAGIDRFSPAAGIERGFQ